MRISDWSSDVCSSDLGGGLAGPESRRRRVRGSRSRSDLLSGHFRRGPGPRRCQRPAGPPAGALRLRGRVKRRLTLFAAAALACRSLLNFKQELTPASDNRQLEELCALAACGTPAFVAA